MKQKEISLVIYKRLKKIDRLFRKIIRRFEMESIHEFRTEIKKLRAFLRLLNVEIDDDSKLKISKDMKIFYDYAGTIRNLQLQLKTMYAYTGDPQCIGIETYIEYLNKIIEKWKGEAIEFFGAKNNIHDDKTRIIQQLPGKLRRASVKAFLQHKINELASLVKELPGDDVLHTIRKILKDILYNWSLIKQDKKLLPPALSEEEKIKSFTEMLGLFMDKSMGIILLETYYKDCEENGGFIEKDINELQEIERTWKNEKQELVQIIYLNPGLLQLSAVS